MKNITFGGSLVRDVAALPGLGDKFVTISRKYTKKAFGKVSAALQDSFAKTNAEELTDDFGKVWPPNSLLHLGDDGRDDGKIILLVHKFIPLENIYSAVSFGILRDGTAF